MHTAGSHGIWLLSPKHPWTLTLKYHHVTWGEHAWSRATSLLLDNKAHYLAERMWVALSVISALRASCASGVNSLANSSQYMRFPQGLLSGTSPDAVNDSRNIVDCQSVNQFTEQDILRFESVESTQLRCQPDQLQWVETKLKQVGMRCVFFLLKFRKQ